MPPGEIWYPRGLGGVVWVSAERSWHEPTASRPSIRRQRPGRSRMRMLGEMPDGHAAWRNADPWARDCGYRSWTCTDCNAKKDLPLLNF